MRLIAGMLICLLGTLIGTPTRADSSLEILSPHWEGMRYEIEHGFNAQRARLGKQKINFNWIDVGGTSDILRFIHSEFKRRPDGIGVDLLFGGGIDPFIDLKGAGLLTRAKAADLQEIDIAQSVAGNPLHDPDQFYFSGLISSFGIMCNRAVLAARNLPTPSTWMDLADKRFASWISIADPRRSGSSHLVFEIFLQGLGWDKGWTFLNNLAANARVILPSSPQVGRDVVNGEAACGLLIDSHATAQIVEFGSNRLLYVVPQDLPVMNGDGVGILKGAPNSDNAYEFLRFILSREGQRLLYRKKGSAGGPSKFELARFSILPSVFSEPGETLVTGNPFLATTPVRYSSELGSRRWNIVNDLSRVFLIERRPVRNLSFRLPVSENDVEQIAASGSWRIPEKRLATIARWRKAAQ